MERSSIEFYWIQKKYSDNMFLLKYNDLNHDPLNIIKDIFSFSNLEMGRQTVDFINQSTSKNTENTYSVYRKKYKDDSWKDQLNPYIINEIFEDLNGTRLERFLE
jgi:hypothetical protein